MTRQIVTTMYNIILCGSRKYPNLPQGKVNIQNFEGKQKLSWNFQRGKDIFWTAPQKFFIGKAPP